MDLTKGSTSTCFHGVPDPFLVIQGQPFLITLGVSSSTT